MGRFSVVRSFAFSSRVRRRLATRYGLTLLELVVVIGILSALAGLVITKVDWGRRQADMATAADTCAELARNIQVYVSEQAKLPEGFDSLITSTGAAFYGSATTNSTTPGLIASSPNLCSMTTLETFPAGDARSNSLSRNGFTSVYDHVLTGIPATYSASNSATSYRAISRTTSNQFLCVTPGSALWNLIYPLNLSSSEVDETNVSLVCVGVGPNTSMLGRTLVDAPTYSGSYNNNPALDYRRYVAIFAAYTDGSRAQLKTVVDSFGRTSNQALEQFIQAKAR
jgi:type II secretory pathway pseudopilin PulG